jgi:SH3-like domain-containing protein
MKRNGQSRHRIGVLAGLLCLTMLAGHAQAEGAAQADTPERGPVTHLPLPRYVSLKASEGNIRRGPSLTHRIDWVFTHRHMPLQVTGEYENWRRVQDSDGVGGWIHFTLLSGARTGLIETDLAPVYARADTQSTVKARLEVGVIISLDSCAIDWCRVRVEGVKGWMVKSAFWGVDPDEVFD